MLTKRKAPTKKGASGKSKVQSKKKRSRSQTADTVASRIADWKSKTRHRKPKHRYEIDCECSAPALHLRGMGLTKVPEEIRSLHDIEALNLTGNEIEELPDWIGELRSLRLLGLSGNKLRKVPTSLRELKQLRGLLLRGNKIEEIPTWVLRKQFAHIDISRNPLSGISKSILASKSDTILGYLRRTQLETTEPLQELKLLLVGRGGAGKTTLVRRLAGLSPNEAEPETHSIAISELMVPCAPGPVRVRAWDFGGQEILHSTHRFFLTERSLYIVVLEPRSNLAQRDAEYWLKLIEVQGSRSPTIVVLNWSQQVKWDVDRVRLKRQFPFIVDFVVADALQGQGVGTLRELLSKTIEGIRDAWLPFPKRWRQIKDVVAGMRENFLSYSQYEEICIRHGEFDPAAQTELANILHVLGLALYFGHDPRLHDTRVLNPSWVTGGVYAVIRSRTARDKNGLVSLRDMAQVILDADIDGVIKRQDYPLDTLEFILELMKAFHLCFAAEDEDGKPTKFLVPELLPEFEPALTQQWDAAPTRVRYRYEILPPGLVPRLIVRTHGLSEATFHWRLGVVLQHAGAEALVRAETERNEVHVFVLGENEEIRRVLGTMVRAELAALHVEMQVKPVEELELSGDKEQWIGVQALEEIAETKRGQQTLPVQPVGVAKVNVTRELEKLAPSPSRRQVKKSDQEVRVFVSYAHEDERQVRRLDFILSAMEQYGEIEVWTDKRLIAGEEWDEEIRRRLEEMDVFVFVASQRSLVRPYILKTEISRALERRLQGQIEVATVKLEPCACDDHPEIGKFQRLAAKLKTIAETSPRSKAWEQVRVDLTELVRRFKAKSPTRRVRSNAQR